jgi:NADPH-dependent glutamate synthase beta subunit-like oxidoreductase
MPAAQEEIDDANREGVEIQGQLQPVEVVTDGNGRAVAGLFRQYFQCYPNDEQQKQHQLKYRHHQYKSLYQ